MIAYFVNDFEKASNFFELLISPLKINSESLYKICDNDHLLIKIPQHKLSISLMKLSFKSDFQRPFLNDNIDTNQLSLCDSTSFPNPPLLCLSITESEFDIINQTFLNSQYNIYAINQSLFIIKGPENIEVSILKSSKKEGTNTILDEFISCVKSTSNSIAISADNLATKKDLISSVAASVSNKRDDSPNSGEFISTLHLSILQVENGLKLYKPIFANSLRPIRFKTDLFDGEVLFLVNTNNNAYYSKSDTSTNAYKQRFLEGDASQRKITFELQVQGKFLQLPNGKLFCGAEITKCMQLGLVTRGMCGTILQVARRMNSYLHHSFGDNADFEKPHLVSPLWSTVDKLVISTPSETPPQLGSILPEPIERRTERKKSPDHPVNICLDNVYSFSVNTENLDVINWRAVNIPFLSSLDLTTFWSDADLRLCVYFVPNDASLNDKTKPNATTGLPSYHPQSINKYLFNVDIKNTCNHPELVAPQQIFIESDEEIDIEREEVINVASISNRDSSSAYSTVTADSGVEKIKSRIKSDRSLESQASWTDSEINGMRRTMAASFVSYQRDRDPNNTPATPATTTTTGNTSVTTGRQAVGGEHLAAAADDDDSSEVVSQAIDSDDEEDDEGDIFFDAIAGSRSVDSLIDLNSADDPMSNNIDTIDKDIQVLRGDINSRNMSMKGSRKRRGEADLSTTTTTHFTSVCWKERDFCTDYCVAALETSDDDIPRATLSTLRNKSQRCLYAFRLKWALNLGMSLSLAGDGEGVETHHEVVFRSFDDWREAGLSLFSFYENPPAKLSRKADIEQRRIALQRAYRISCDRIMAGDGEIKQKLQKFLSNDKKTTEILRPTAAIKFVSHNPVSTTATASAKTFNISRLRESISEFSGLQSYLNKNTTQLMRALVAIQKGPHVWCQELVTLTSSAIVFVSRHQLGRVKKFSLPFCSITDFSAVQVAHLPFYVSDLRGLLISTFSRQFNMVLRCDDSTYSEWIVNLSGLCPKTKERDTAVDEGAFTTRASNINTAKQTPTSASSKLSQFKRIMSDKITKHLPNTMDNFASTVTRKYNNPNSSKNDSSPSHTDSDSPRQLEGNTHIS